jgi:IclR family KDG regulon transcriptional repressor
MTTVERRRRSEPGSRYQIGSLGRALDLLELVGEQPGLTLTELARTSELTKVTVFRILANLERRGYVRRDEATGRYRLGMKVIELGSRLVDELDLRLIARPILEELRNQSGETVNLAVPVDWRITYIDILQSSQGLRMAATVGATDDLHSTALGKAILAFEPPDAIREFFAGRRLLQKTERTITAEKRLREELAAVRARGYSVDDEENEIGARCAAAAVLGPDGSAVGAVSISGPATRMTLERLDELGPLIRRSSENISERLGFSHLDRRADSRRGEERGEQMR